MAASPIVLVPGFWLGAWAWDDVAGRLRAAGHDVTALTLPGLDATSTDRSGIGLEDHVAAICAAVERLPGPVLLAAHSGSGVAAYAASDRMPQAFQRILYVDSGPGNAALLPDLEGHDLPMPSLADLAEEENLDGLSDEQLATFAERAVPEPGDVVRGAPVLTNPGRLAVPTTVLCTSFPSAQVKEAVAEGQAWVGGLVELQDVTWVDLPTSHWPMWSRPQELVDLLAELAG